MSTEGLLCHPVERRIIFFSNNSPQNCTVGAELLHFDEMLRRVAQLATCSCSTICWPICKLKPWPPRDSPHQKHFARCFSVHTSGECHPGLPHCHTQDPTRSQMFAGKGLVPSTPSRHQIGQWQTHAGFLWIFVAVSPHVRSPLTQSLWDDHH